MMFEGRGGRGGGVSTLGYRAYVRTSRAFLSLLEYSKSEYLHQK